MEAVIIAGNYLIMLMFFLAPAALVAIDFVFFVKKKEQPLFELCAFFVGGVYTLLAYVLWDLPPYYEALNLYGLENAHEPFCSEHFICILLCALWGFGSYWILKSRRKSLPPLWEAFLLAGVYVGCALSFAWILQLLGGVKEQAYVENGKTMEIRLAVHDLAAIGALCVVPFLYLLHAVWLLVRMIKEKAAKQEAARYENPVLQKINSWLLRGANLFLAAVVALLPVLGILVLLLCLFGQQPDGIIQAFTKTSGWILSKEISPPPVAYDTHYLCTVSLRGHRRLVRPLRYGIRRGEKIVVNRQLCVANAFEELISERAPRFHRAVRGFYDRYGYPLSRHINSAWSADAVYLLMKPLEWVFVLTLYLLEERPEDRICRQYLPQGRTLPSKQGKNVIG